MPVTHARQRFIRLPQTPAPGGGASRRTPLVLIILSVALAAPAAATAQASCEFVVTGTTMLLSGPCATTTSIEVPDGMTLDGSHHTIMALDPPDGPFAGAVVVARGGMASVVNTGISTALLRAGCHTGAERLRGILFEGASGVIRGNTVDNVRRESSACEEGIGIEVRNLQDEAVSTFVEITANAVDRYQKGGVVVHGGVEAAIRGNAIGASAAQSLVPANAIQVGPGARGVVEGNAVLGNSFASPRAAGTAILLVGSAPGTLVAANSIAGNSDVGIHVLADGAVIRENVVRDEGGDGYWDVGIVNMGLGNTFLDNVVEGFRRPDLGIDDLPPGNGLRLE